MDDVTRFNGNEVIIERTFRAGDPTVNDDNRNAFRQGSEWYNTVTKEKFVLLDDTGGAAAWEGQGAGVVASANLNLATEPTAADTVVVGADTYEFVATGGNVANDANIAVELAGAVATTRASLVSAINAADADNLHANIKNVADSAPAKANGTESVFAVVSGTKVVVESAVAPGGSVVAAAPSIVLGETLTNVSDLWIEGDVNMNTLGASEVGSEEARIELTITAAMLSEGTQKIVLPFAPKGFIAQVVTSAGVARVPATDAYAVGAGDITVTFGGGAAPDIQATDILHLHAWS